MTSISAGGGPRYLYFVSYARRDANELLVSFLDDLCALVTDKFPEWPGYDRIEWRDRNAIEPGEAWRKSLEDGIANSHVFLGIMSPRYLSRPYCRAEWNLFQQRTGGAGDDARLQIPLFWLPFDENDERISTAGCQLVQHELDRGRRVPYYDICFEPELHRGARSRALQVVANAILGAAERNRSGAAPLLPGAALALDVDPLDGISSDGLPGTAVVVPGPHPAGARPVATRPRRPNGPHGGDNQRMVTRQPPASAPDGAGHGDLETADVLFVVAAANRQRIARKYRRRRQDYYGADFRQWTPYWNQTTDYDSSAVNDARDVARAVVGRRRGIADCELNSATIDLVDGAMERKQIVVFLVEPWSTPMPEYNDTLLNLDRSLLPTSTIVVPWSKTDPQTHDGTRPATWHSTTFGRRIRARDNGDRTAIYDDLATPELFREELGRYITKMFDGIVAAQADRGQRAANWDDQQLPDPGPKPLQALGE